MYTHADASVPEEWGDSEDRALKNSTDVALRSFSTHVHRVGAMVSYRQMDDSDDEWYIVQSDWACRRLLTSISFSFYYCLDNNVLSSCQQHGRVLKHEIYVLIIKHSTMSLVQNATAGHLHVALAKCVTSKRSCDTHTTRQAQSGQGSVLKKSTVGFLCLFPY